MFDIFSFFSDLPPHLKYLKASLAEALVVALVIATGALAVTILV